MWGSDGDRGETLVSPGQVGLCVKLESNTSSHHTRLYQLFFWHGSCMVIDFFFVTVTDLIVMQLMP